MCETQGYIEKVVFWGLSDDGWIGAETIESLVEKYLQVMEIDEEEADEEITIYGYVKKEIKKDRLVHWLLPELIEHMDEEYTAEEGNMKIADIPEVRNSAFKLIQAIIKNGYNVEELRKVCEKKIKISDYV